MTRILLLWLPVPVLLLAVIFTSCDSSSSAASLKRPDDFQANEQPAVEAAQTGAGDGATIFRQNCVTCHGADGKLGMNGAKDLTASKLTREQRIDIVTHGKNMMAAFDEVLTPEEIRAVADYTMTLK